MEWYRNSLVREEAAMYGSYVGYTFPKMLVNTVKHGV